MILKIGLSRQKALKSFQTADFAQTILEIFKMSANFAKHSFKIHPSFRFLDDSSDWPAKAAVQELSFPATCCLCARDWPVHLVYLGVPAKLVGNHGAERNQQEEEGKHFLHLKRAFQMEIRRFV